MLLFHIYAFDTWPLVLNDLKHDITFLLLVMLYFICFFLCEYFCLYGACFLDICSWHFISPFPCLQLSFLRVVPYLIFFCNMVHSFAMCSCHLIHALLLLITLNFICLFLCEYFCLYNACFLDIYSWHLISPFPC